MPLQVVMGFLSLLTAALFVWLPLLTNAFIPLPHSTTIIPSCRLAKPPVTQITSSGVKILSPLTLLRSSIEDAPTDKQTVGGIFTHPAHEGGFVLMEGESCIVGQHRVTSIAVWSHDSHALIM